MSNGSGGLTKALRPHATPYDVLGYLIPGAMFLLLALSFDALTSDLGSSPPRPTPLYDLAVGVVVSSAPGQSWAVGAVVLVVAIIVAYAVGHIIASVSAIFIDRVYLSKGHGYPMPRMLGAVVNDKWDLSQNFYRAVFVWLNIYVVLRFLSVPGALSWHEFLSHPLMYTSPASSSLGAARLSQITTWIAWGLVVLVGAKWFLGARRWRSVPKKYRSFAQGIHLVLELVLLVLAYPARVITGFLGRVLHTRGPIDPGTVAQFRAGLSRILGFDVDFASSAPYWYSVIHVRACSAQAAEACDNWLRLYGFARNLACACYLGFLYCYIAWLNYGASFRSEGAIAQLLVIYAYPLGLLCAAWILLLRFYYLYVAYYTKYLIRTIAYLGREVAQH